MLLRPGKVSLRRAEIGAGDVGRDEHRLRDLVVVRTERIDRPAVRHDDATVLVIIAYIVSALGTA